MLHSGADAYVPAADLYRAFKQWSEEAKNEAPLTGTAFGSRVGAKGYESGRSGGQRIRRDRRLRADIQPLVNPGGYSLSDA